MEQYLGLPAYLFKYTKKEHAMAMVYEGEFRIGTLYEYRNTESHALDVGDAHEGALTYSTGEFFDASKDLESAPILLQEAMNKFFKRDDGGVGGYRILGETKWTLTIGDSYVYCASEGEPADPEVMRKLDADYDACVRIEEPWLFFNEVGATLARKIGRPLHGNIGHCVYIEREQHYSRIGDLNPAFVKEPEYAYQREWRVAWPVPGQLEPVILQGCSASRLCSLEWYYDDPATIVSQY